MKYKLILKRPIAISVLSLICILNPVGNFIFQYVIFNYKFHGDFIKFILTIYKSMFIKYDFNVIINVSLWIISIIIGYGIYKVKIWAFLAWVDLGREAGVAQW